MPSRADPNQTYVLSSSAYICALCAICGGISKPHHTQGHVAGRLWVGGFPATDLRFSVSSLLRQAYTGQARACQPVAGFSSVCPSSGLWPPASASAALQLGDHLRHRLLQIPLGFKTEALFDLGRVVPRVADQLFQRIGIEHKTATTEAANVIA